MVQATRVGKATSHPSVPQGLPVTRMKRDTLLAMRTRAKPSTVCLTADRRPAH